MKKLILIASLLALTGCSDWISDHPYTSGQYKPAPENQQPVPLNKH